MNFAQVEKRPTRMFADTALDGMMTISLRVSVSGCRDRPRRIGRHLEIGHVKSHRLYPSVDSQKRRMAQEGLRL